MVVSQIRTLCLSPDGALLLAIDEDGRSLLINKRRRVLLHHFSFKGPVSAACFSPDGQHIACAVGKVLQVRLSLPTRSAVTLMPREMPGSRSKALPRPAHIARTQLLWRRAP